MKDFEDYFRTTSGIENQSRMELDNGFSFILYLEHL